MPFSIPLIQLWPGSNGRYPTDSTSSIDGAVTWNSNDKLSPLIICSSLEFKLTVFKISLIGSVGFASGVNPM